MKPKTNKIISIASIAMVAITLALAIFTVISFNSKDSKIDRAYHENRIAELDEDLADAEESLKEMEAEIEKLGKYASYLTNVDEYYSTHDSLKDTLISGKRLSYETLTKLDNAEERNKTLLISTIISLVFTLVLLVIYVISKKKTNSNNKQESPL